MTPQPYPPAMLPRIEVSPAGNVRVRRKNRSLGEPLKPDYTRLGQPRVKLRAPDGSYRHVLLHRLVYYACTGDDRMFDREVVCLDGDKANVYILNLRLKGEEDKDIKPLLKLSVLSELDFMRDGRLLPPDMSLDAKLKALDAMLDSMSKQGGD